MRPRPCETDKGKTHHEPKRQAYIIDNDTRNTEQTMQTQYTTKVLTRSPRGAIKGELYEGDVLVATFAKPAAGWYHGTVMKFGSTAAAARFDDFCDSLSRSETLEAITE